MLSFLLAWIVVLIVIRIYLSKKEINIGINNDIIALVLSFSMVAFLNIIQMLFKFLLSFFIK